LEIFHNKRKKMKTCTNTTTNLLTTTSLPGPCRRPHDIFAMEIINHYRQATFGLDGGTRSRRVIQGEL